MLIDSWLLKNADLVRFPGRLVVSIGVRSLGLEDSWGMSFVHGEEGVWKWDEVDMPCRLEPFEKEEKIRFLFDLSVDMKDCRGFVRKRWLVRHWNGDVYLPTVDCFYIELSGCPDSWWNVSWLDHSVLGIDIGGRR